MSDEPTRASGELTFFTGPMDSGKSTLALQMGHTQSVHGRRGLMFTTHDRSGDPTITSRIGLEQTAFEVEPELDLWAHVVDLLTSGERIDFLICDEAQFYQPEQIDQLARVVDDLGIDVFCFGLLTDFRTQLFPGSRRLVELADHVQTMQVQPLCWCGRKASVNARVVGGQLVTEGSQVLVGDTGDNVNADQVSYEVVCRKHFRLRQPAVRTGGQLGEDVLPFSD